MSHVYAEDPKYPNDCINDDEPDCAAATTDEDESLRTIPEHDLSDSKRAKLRTGDEDPKWVKSKRKGDEPK